MVLVVSCMQWARGCHLYILSFISLTYHCDPIQERPYPNHWAIVGTGPNAMRSKQKIRIESMASSCHETCGGVQNL